MSEPANPEFIIETRESAFARRVVTATAGFVIGMAITAAIMAWFQRSSDPDPDPVVTIVSTGGAFRPPCLLRESDPLHEIYTARLLWWTVANGRSVSLKRIETIGASHGAITADALYLDPCGQSNDATSITRLATILHELGHALEPGSVPITFSQSQAFADAVALKAGELLAIDVAPGLPTRTELPADAWTYVRGNYGVEINEAADVLAAVARSEQP